MQYSTLIAFYVNLNKYIYSQSYNGFEPESLERERELVSRFYTGKFPSNARFEVDSAKLLLSTNCSPNYCPKFELKIKTSFGFNYEPFVYTSQFKPQGT